MKDTQEVTVVAEMELVSPASAEKILKTFKSFEWMKQNVITSNDRQKIGDKSFIKKSGWMKVALACNISMEKREERVEQDGDETIYHYTYRAVAPSGRFADADASASTAERKFTHIPHDVRSLAQTRACNRCVSNLVGGGVSAEEMSSTKPAEDREIKPSKDSATKKTPRQKTTLDSDIVKALNAADLDVDVLDIRYDLETEGSVISVRGSMGKILWKKYDSVLRKQGFGWDGKTNHWR